MRSELNEKTVRLERMLASEGLGGILLSAQHNFAWLTGGASNRIDVSRENGAASLLVAANGRRFILSNNIEMPRMLAEAISSDEFEPIEHSWQDEKASADFVIRKARSLAAGEIVGDNAVEGKIAACRYLLTSDEIDRYRVLGKDAAAAIPGIIDKILPGDTEIEIAEKVRHELAIGGMTSIVTLVAADDRISQFRHPVPSENRWNKTLLLVTCAERGGLIASLSRMICVGEVPGEMKRRSDAAGYVHASLMDASRPGASGADLYKTAANAYAEKGFDEQIGLHHQGGAAGYRTREWLIHPASTDLVHAGQAFAWNPSITGTKVEETSIVHKEGVEVITGSTGFPQIADFVNGREYFSPGIFSL